ncbi:DHA2 family efflux MFS transporter permease subunit [Paenibacillus psychroresistens]|uniref:DHA2 family efflux MFS transporter permease subunit n=1 Tax=Paenibacillus psychroresistens TaxID=1778678 RepID=A0A6B8RBX2_9BACL|nr:MDR family MFS transporter [Paenibacillus psychroresistens]QGQ94041.1 DHA2 family efflux MFS transporter permease subunit [Paenibacillus psychroresistens]
MSAGSAKDLTKEKPQTIKEILVPLITIIMGLFMVILDGTAVNVAIPKLTAEFNSTFEVLQWTVTGYALANAAVIPLAGWLSDRFGAKNIFLFSVAFFTLGSLLCAIATNPAQLITYRIIQGIGGGMVMPIAMAFIYRLSPPDKVGAVMGIMGIPILLAPALGPLLAGWLVDYAYWQWIFIVNLPIGIIAIVVGIRSLPSIQRQAVAALDKFGILLAPIAFAGLSYGVSEGGNGWSSAKTITGLTVGVIALLLFIIVELRHKQPILELRVFKSMDFSKAIVIQWISQIALFGTMFMIPLFLQRAQGYSAFDTGLIMLPQAIAAGIFMPISGALFDKIGARPLVMGGMAIVTGAAFMLTQIDASNGISALILPLALIGAGMGLSMMPLNTHLIQASPQNLVGRVTSLTNAAQQVMTSFAVAGLITILASKMKIFMPADGIPTPETWTQSFSGTFKVLVYIALVGLVLAFLLKKPKKLEGHVQSAEELEASKMFV